MTDEVRRADVRHTRRLSLIALSMVLPAVLLTGGCSMFGKLIPGFSPAPQTPVATGAWQVPPNDSKASASGTIRVGADRSVSGVIGLRGIEATGVRIHTGVAGVKGAPINAGRHRGQHLRGAGRRLSQPGPVCRLAGRQPVHRCSERRLSGGRTARTAETLNGVPARSVPAVSYIPVRGAAPELCPTSVDNSVHKPRFRTQVPDLPELSLLARVCINTAEPAIRQ
jgi:hypothetical protein